MPIIRGSTQITDIRRGTTLINEVRRGQTLIWTRVVRRDDFDRADSTTLGSNWTDEGSSTDHKIGISSGTARLQIPDGLVGGFWAARTSRMRYNVSVSSADDGYIEAKMASKGDPFTPIALGGFISQLFGRVTNSAFTSGIGFSCIAGHVWITKRISSIDNIAADGGTFQPGDKIRLTYVGNLHTLFVNGAQRAQWNDSGGTVPKGASYRSMGLRCDGGKDLLGPRRFSPAFDYVLMS